MVSTLNMGDYFFITGESHLWIMWISTPAGDPASHLYRSLSHIDPSRVLIHSQDFSHNMKKLRNAILSSGSGEQHTRKLTKDGKLIVWQQWVDAVTWDRETNRPE